MHYGTLGATDLDVSEIGMGCQSLGGGLYYRNDRESVRTLHRAVDAGVNFFDVSDHHTQGVAERILGKAFAGRRSDVVITTKAGYCYTPLGSLGLKARHLIRPVSVVLRPFKRSLHLMRASQGRYNFAPDYIRRAIENSLRRLRTDYVDLYQLYKPSVDIMNAEAFQDTLGALEDLKRQGKIRYYGIACQWVREALECLRFPGISSVQVAVNLIEPEAAGELIARARDKRVAVIARHPRAIGLLTNAASDIMGDTSYYDRQHEDREAQAKNFRFLIRGDRTLAQAAIQYVLGLSGIATVIPRAVDRKELEENLDALTAPPLTADELAQIAALQSAAPATAGNGAAGTGSARGT
jgi:aryl-alcohol dehydrogenase-like predicted oxidoreductase